MKAWLLDFYHKTLANPNLGRGPCVEVSPSRRVLNSKVADTSCPVDYYEVPRYRVDLSRKKRGSIISLYSPFACFLRISEPKLYLIVKPDFEYSFAEASHPPEEVS